MRYLNGLDGFVDTTAHPKCKPRKVYDNFNDACDAYIKRYEDRVKKQTNKKRFKYITP